MNSRERLLATLRREKPDRIAIAPFVYINNAYELFGYEPTIENFYDPQDFDIVTKFVDYCEHYGFDCMHPHGLIWEGYVRDSGENWDVTITDEDTQDNKRRITTVKTPQGSLRQIANFRRNGPHMIVYAIEEYLLKTKADFEIFSRYTPPANYIDRQLVTRMRSAVGDKGLACPATYGAFNTLNMFRKLDLLLMDPYTDEGFYRAMMDFFLAWNRPLLRAVIDAGADAVEIGGNMATSMVGPCFFSEFVLEYEKRMIDDIHEAGAFVVYHNCGDAGKIMHLYNDVGMDVWGYLTPPPFGDVDLDEALRVIRPDMVLRGNIDQVEFLRRASPEEITNKVRDLMLKVKPRGNWMLSTTDFFFDGTPEENIRAFVAAGKKYGAY